MSRRKRRENKLESKHKLKRRVYGLIPLAICIIVLTYFFFPHQEQNPVNDGVTIVDLFYSTNPQFTNEVTAFLTSKDITTNTFKDANITVDFYKKLPKYGSSLIVLRVHAGVLENDPTKPTFLFTEEPHNTNKYPIEQMLKQVQAGVIDPDDSTEEPVFTVGPLFVAISMEGNFSDSIVILSSCLGLYREQLAKAFIERGAKAFISWDEKVGLTHTDEATMVLLRSLVEGGMTVSEAVEKAMNDVGPDTAYNSILHYYPQEAGNIKLVNLR